MNSDFEKKYDRNILSRMLEVEHIQKFYQYYQSSRRQKFFFKKLVHVCNSCNLQSITLGSSNGPCYSLFLVFKFPSLTFLLLLKLLIPFLILDISSSQLIMAHSAHINWGAWHIFILISPCCTPDTLHLRKQKFLEQGT